MRVAATICPCPCKSRLATAGRQPTASGGTINATDVRQTDRQTDRRQTRIIAYMLPTLGAGHKYGVRPPSWICKKKINFSLRVHSRNQYPHLHIKFCRYRMIRRWHVERKTFSKWRPSAIMNFRILTFGPVTCACEWFNVLLRNFALIGQYGEEVQPKTIFGVNTGKTWNEIF